jgi:hypothetical protein
VRVPGVSVLARSSAPEGGPAATTPPTAPAPATPSRTAAPPLRLEAHYRVSWGYGCGGNCAQNTRGESTVELTAEGKRLRMKDAGEIATTHASPGSLVTEKRLWSFGGFGELTRGTGSMTLGLSQLDGHCKDSEDHGTGARFEPCKHRPPARLTIDCARDEVDADGAKRPVWRCEPDPPIPAASGAAPRSGPSTTRSTPPTPASRSRPPTPAAPARLIASRSGCMEAARSSQPADTKSSSRHALDRRAGDRRVR